MKFRLVFPKKGTSPIEVLKPIWKAPKCQVVSDPVYDHSDGGNTKRYYNHEKQLQLVGGLSIKVFHDRWINQSPSQLEKLSQIRSLKEKRLNGEILKAVSNFLTNSTSLLKNGKPCLSNVFIKEVKTTPDRKGLFVFWGPLDASEPLFIDLANKQLEQLIYPLRSHLESSTGFRFPSLIKFISDPRARGLDSFENSS